LPPIVEQLDPAPSVGTALRQIEGRGSPILFDSSLLRPPLGRYSSLSADPVRVYRLDEPTADPFSAIRRDLAAFGTMPSLPDLGGFVGGAAGFLSYEMGRSFERLPVPPLAGAPLPAMHVGLYDWSIVWDHFTGRCWIVSTGFPETSETARLARARDRIRQVREWLGAPPLAAPQTVPDGGVEIDGHSLAMPSLPLLKSNFTRPQYLEAVARVVEYIRAGDIFQANLSQQLSHPFGGSPVELYEILRKVNPAPFAGYMAADGWAIASASPERFFEVRGDEVSTRPIKGTRRRWHDRPEADLFRADELRESDKDLSENVMIVDLLRNDLSRVCRPGSIRVPQLCRVETYETVQHLVSEVRGELQPGRDFWDILSAAFPGGSITGAPKVRAMEIITELEQIPRGPYCGTLFYSGFDGRSDSNILIRTFVIAEGLLRCSVGGGVVVASDPAAEYAETLHKAAGMLRALEAWQQAAH
jgi:para-aminobenzoate synthetase component 1